MQNKEKSERTRQNPLDKDLQEQLKLVLPELENLLLLIIFFLFFITFVKLEGRHSMTRRSVARSPVAISPMERSYRVTSE